MQERNKIKSVLSEQNIKVNQLAEALGKNVNTVSRWANNKQQPSLEVLYQIADFLKVEVWALLVRNDLTQPIEA